MTPLLPLTVGGQRPVVDRSFINLLQASIVGVSLQLASVWLTPIGILTGAGAAWAFWTGEDIQTAAAVGAGIGFVLGLPLTACAGLMLILGL